MSKVEKALQKALAMEGAQAVPAGMPAGPEIPPAQQLVPSQTEAPPVAGAPDLTAMAEPWRLSESDMAESRIIFPEMDDQRAVDAFRAIRTTVVQRSAGKNCVILVTSSGGEGGASFVALNLAVAFTLDERKSALLIDCNLRNPALENLVSSDMHYGLTDYLEADAIEARQIIHPVGIPRLRLIPAGRKSEIPTEQLGAARMKGLVDGLKRRYPDRYVVLDVSSVSDTADTRVLAELSDFILLVVPYGKADESQIWSAAAHFDEEKFLGVVFNNEPQLPRLSWN